MKEKHLKVFAGVFVFLLIVHFITKPRHAGVNIDEFVQSIVIGVAEKDVHSVEVYKLLTGGGRAQMMLVREDEETWRIPTRFNCRVQKSKMDRLLTELIEMTGKVRSSDPKHFDTYEINDEEGIHLIMKDAAEKPLANLIIGKKGEDYNSGFVRIADKEKVYAVDKNILSSLSVYGEIDTLKQFNQKSFVDLQAVNQEEDALDMIGMVVNRREMIVKKIEKKVEVSDTDSTTTTKKETEWVLMRGGREVTLDQDEVDKFLRDVKSIRATEAVDRIGSALSDINKSSRYGFSRPTHYLVFRSADRPQENVIFGKAYEEDEGYYMQVQYDAGLVYKVAKSTYDKIFAWMDDLPEKTVD